MKHTMTNRLRGLTDSRKKDFFFSTGWNKVCTDSYWSGGSISYWLVVNIHTNVRLRPPAGQYPWTTPNDYTLQPGDVVIETGRSNNKEAMPSVKCRAEDSAAVLDWLKR